MSFRSWMNRTLRYNLFLLFCRYSVNDSGANFFAPKCCQKREYTNSIAYARGKELSANDVGHQYNFQHLVLVTKYRYKMFGKLKTINAVRNALYDVAERYRMKIKELSFGDDCSHVHLEISIPNTMSVSYAVQLLKGYLSYVVSREVSNHRLRYFKRHFRSAGYSNGSVGPRDERTLQNPPEDKISQKDKQLLQCNCITLLWIPRPFRPAKLRRPELCQQQRIRNHTDRA